VGPSPANAVTTVTSLSAAIDAAACPGVDVPYLVAHTSGARITQDSAPAAPYVCELELDFAGSPPTSLELGVQHLADPSAANDLCDSILQQGTAEQVSLPDGLGVTTSGSDGAPSAAACVGTAYLAILNNGDAGWGTDDSLHMLQSFSSTQR
jgi:hypothetical protein